jgi:hypothetical protein
MKTATFHSSLNIRNLGLLAKALNNVGNVGAFPDKSKAKDSYFSHRAQTVELFGSKASCTAVEAEIRSLLAKIEKDALIIVDANKVIQAQEFEQMRKKYGDTLAICSGKKKVRLYSLDKHLAAKAEAQISAMINERETKTFLFPLKDYSASHDLVKVVKVITQDNEMHKTLRETFSASAKQCPEGFELTANTG